MGGIDTQEQVITTRCVECGALLISNDGCTERFHRFLALEYADPAYGAVHHLTVCAYMLQHPSKLSRRGWLEMRDQLTQFLANQLAPAEVRVKNRKDADNQNRSWSFTKGESLELPTEFRWTTTILSVDDSMAAQYCQDIKRWAQQVAVDAATIK